jgi:hypothetical protein
MLTEETTANQASKTKAEFWQYHIESCSNSSLTQAQYCRENSLALATFCYWKKKLKMASPSKARFYPLTVQPETSMVHPSPCSTGVSLHLRNYKFRIEVAENFSEATLKRLITVLEQS